MLKIKWPALCVGACALLVSGALLGYGWAVKKLSSTVSPAMPQQHQVLYWYDPMVPDQKFDKPGKSPFMDMELVAKYADESMDAGTVTIDPRIVQNLGMRTAVVKRAAVENRVDATGMLVFNERDVAVLQSRSAGFVERVAKLAPGDLVAKGDVIAEVLMPEWVALQQEVLSLNEGDKYLLAAGRERMRIAGMPAELIRQIEKTKQLQTHIKLTAPRAGIIQELGIRTGMTLMVGQFIARIQGIDKVWLEVAVPEAQANHIQLGQLAQAHFSALPEKTIQGKVTSILPELNAMTRTLRVRVELPNPRHQLRPGLSAQVTLKNNNKKTALVVPTESIIRTGQRSLVMVAEDHGHYRPVEIILGQEIGDNTVVIQGVEESQRVVTSGQFLIDSEASLKGIIPQLNDGAKL